MDSESKGFLQLWAGIIIVLLGLSGIAYWGGLITLPVANQLQEKARVANPLVVSAQQDRALEILASIERLEKQLPKLNPEEQAQSKTSIAGLEQQLTRVLGTLTEDQIPYQVKAHRAKHTSI